MEEAVPGGSGVAREEAEKERVITPCESGIATPRSARDADGGAIPRTWNASHLKFYFS